jgi:predicted nucleic acid-binding protein
MGMAQSKLVLDTNAGIFLTTHNHAELPLKQTLDAVDVFVSLITPMELLSKPGMEAAEVQAIMDFLTHVVVIPIDAPIEAAAIELRRSDPKIKLPDAIIAATAIVLGATLLTNDDQLLRLSRPGYQTQAINR